MEVEKGLSFVTLQTMSSTSHNTAFLDGNRTFRGMGIVPVFTPAREDTRRIPRGEVSMDEIRIGKIDFHFYRYRSVLSYSFSYKTVINKKICTFNLVFIFWFCLQTK